MRNSSPYLFLLSLFFANSINGLQDPCFNVRLAFLSKTILLLQPRKPPARYNVIPFLTVIDPESETKIMVCTLFFTLKREFLAITGCILHRNYETEACARYFFIFMRHTIAEISPKALRLENLELLFIRLLHFLAHHPDFATTHDELMDMAR